MKDYILNDYIEELVLKHIDEKMFEEHIDMFSRFLAYTNSAYKYNGTYLTRYIEDFLKMSEKIKLKNGKYYKILNELLKLGYKFEVIIDQVFFASCYLNLKKIKDLENIEIDCGYIGIIKDKIISKKLEIKITFFSRDKEYILCKEYSDSEDEKLIENIRNDIINYTKDKKIKEAS